MKLILQSPHPKACLLACIAMVEGVDLDEIIRIAGSDQPPPYEVRERFAKHFGRVEGYQRTSYSIKNYSDHSLGCLMREHETLIVSISSCIDPQFAHCAVLHREQLYDPHFGMNPTYSWDKTIMRASPPPAKAAESELGLGWR